MYSAQVIIFKKYIKLCLYKMLNKTEEVIIIIIIIM